MDPRLNIIHSAADYIRAILAANALEPKVGIVLGSGLGRLSDEIKGQVVIPYKDIPGFPVSTAIGHKGNFIVGKLSGKTVIAMQGRIHYYEGYEMDTVVLPIRVMKVLGIEYLFVSNAAGGVNTSFKTGDLMIITDHINQIPNPLIGPNMDEFGPRFPDMTRPYDPRLIAIAEEVGKEMGIDLRKGVYFGCTGPTYETPHEYKYMRIVGADAVGMSTTPEVIVARHADIPVFGMSVITDVAHEDDDTEYVTDGEEIVRQADAAAVKMTALFKAIIQRI
ncbi:MAG: purine-nucleoside phosphorylase [Bacteroidales bacterium]|nr:purine-nucleoside phosphorylase [Bacteroidales bacterium]